MRVARRSAAQAAVRAWRGLTGGGEPRSRTSALAREVAPGGG